MQQRGNPQGVLSVGKPKRPQEGGVMLELFLASDEGSYLLKRLRTMTLTIHKYPMIIADFTTLNMPRDANFLHVGELNGRLTL